MSSGPPIVNVKMVVHLRIHINTYEIMLNIHSNIQLTFYQKKKGFSGVMNGTDIYSVPVNIMSSIKVPNKETKSVVTISTPTPVEMSLTIIIKK